MDECKVFVSNDLCGCVGWVKKTNIFTKINQFNIYPNLCNNISSEKKLSFFGHILFQKID